MSAPQPGATDFDVAHTYHGRPFSRRLPLPSTILEHVAERARSAADAPYLTGIGTGGEVEILSYRGLDVLSRRLAGWMARELGLRPGRSLALLPTNDLASVVALFGALRAGCALLLLSPADPPARLREQTAALGIEIVLRSTAVPADMLPEARSVADPRALDDPSPDEPEPALDPFADALFFGTSGSTAASKLVAQSHYNAAVNAEALRRHHGLGPGDRLLGCLPIHHVNGVHFTLFGTLASGAHARLVQRFEPLVYPRFVMEFRPRLASVVPSILESLLETWRRPVVPGELEYFVSAAAPLAARTARAVARELGVPVLQGYGLTETTNFSTTMPRDLPPEARRRLSDAAEIPSIGAALYGNEVAVLRPDGTPAESGEVGELCVRGHNVMTRYAGNAAATAEAFRGGWFHSQDLGFAVEDPDCPQPLFVVTGRTKNVAKVRGESVSLDEIERILRAVPAVRDAACVAFPHRFLGDEIVAAVVGERGHDEPEVWGALRASLAPTALPRRIVALEAIPRTPTGKILRAGLAREVASAPEDGGAA